MNAVDTNVFVYALDTNEPAKQAKAQALLTQLSGRPAETFLLWQVAAELLSCLRKWESLGRIAPADVEAHFRDVLTMFPLHVPTAQVFDYSFHFSSKFPLSHWDSMILAACKGAGATTLYSEDLDAGTNYDGVTVVNPFA
ncbi:MAG: PIN domain-containing protein [Planctomycetes bacterium]|nr:PIN domain-containing protein [Planctomycetota bacterium]